MSTLDASTLFPKSRKRSYRVGTLQCRLNSAILKIFSTRGKRAVDEAYSTDRCAVHEVCHALVAYLYGETIKYVKIASAFDRTKLSTILRTVTNERRFRARRVSEGKWDTPSLTRRARKTPHAGQSLNLDRVWYKRFDPLPWRSPRQVAASAGRLFVAFRRPSPGSC